MSLIDTLQEVAALSSTLGPGAVSVVEPQEYVNAVQLLEDGDVQAAELLLHQQLEAGTPAHQATTVMISYGVRCDVAGAGDCGRCVSCSAQLLLHLPAGYPVQPAACAVISLQLPHSDIGGGSSSAAGGSSSGSCAAGSGSSGNAASSGCASGSSVSGCSTGGAAWMDEAHRRLAEAAREAAEQELPCLFQLHGVMRQLMEEAAAAAAAASSGSGQGRTSTSGAPAGAGGSSSGCPGADQQAEAGGDAAVAASCGGGRGVRAAALGAPQSPEPPPLHLLLLRLDHMHNRAMYSRTVKRWAGELGLTGRLIFQESEGGGSSPGLILILMEGGEQEVKEYLVRHRTETIDVDSRGRKCRERMMDVVAQGARAELACGPPGSKQQHDTKHNGKPQPNIKQSSNVPGGNGSGSTFKGCDAAAGPQGKDGMASDRAFADFAEASVSTLHDVGRILEIAGLGKWLRVAAGLPP